MSEVRKKEINVGLDCLNGLWAPMALKTSHTWVYHFWVPNEVDEEGKNDR